MDEPLIIGVVCGLAVVTVALLVAVVALMRRGPQSDGAAVVDQLARLERRLDETRRATDEQLARSRDAIDRRSDELTAQLSDRLAQINTQLQRELSESRRQVGQSNQQMLSRLESSGKLFAQVTQQFGELREAGRQIADLGSDITRLQQILSPSGGRGQFGEHLLEELLRCTLPAGTYTMQYAFRDGRRVDAAIELAAGVLAIDSKFPLPAFERFIAAEGTDARTAARKQFVRDCRKHIDAIAAKYIRPDEGTLDFALMYIPAENVYYESILAHRDLGESESIAQYAMARRVVCVSPNTLMAYLNVILLGLRGMKVEENAQAILAGMSRLNDELNAFAEEFRVLGRHLSSARRKYSDADKSLEKVSIHLHEVGRLGQGDDTSTGDDATGLRIAAE